MIEHISYTDFKDRYADQVRNVAYEKGRQLALKIANLVLPDYQRFSEKHEWGDPTLLEQAIILIGAAAPGAIDTQLINQLKDGIYAVAPDSEEFGDWDGSYALNAAICVLYGLEYLKNGDPAALNAIGMAYTDTVDYTLHEMGIEDVDAIERHPQMQEARRYLLELSQG